MKRFVFFSLMFLILPFFCFGCENGETKLDCYHIEAVYDESEKSLSCKQTVEYVNNSDNAIDNISFFVYANAFAQGENVVSSAYKSKAYPNGESFGNMQFHSLEVAGEMVEVQMKNDAILIVPLNKQLFPQESVLIDMNYTIMLANINHRLGYGNNAVNFGNFFPIACVYVEGSGFVENSFATNGDPFYSNISNFEVNLTCDKDFIVAASGHKTNEVQKDSIKQHTFSAKKVRDFALVISKKYELVSQEVEGVVVNYFYYDDKDATEHLQTGVDALKTFKEVFGNYPYRQLSVVKTNFCFGGMEYPNLVMISDDLVEKQTIDYVIVHEIAHQWWYGMVGNDQFSQAWVDEGLTEFSCALFFEKNPKYGISYENIMDNARNTYKKFVEIYSKINGDVDESMNRRLNEFATEPEYVNCIYTKGMLLFDSVRQSMNDKKFFKCLENYFEDYCFQNSSSDKLIESFSHSAKINLEGFFKSWIYGEVVIN
ncbi:MAG: M1 family metallopeptidase [Clostridia bacterium]|nr:M1 family metallopeptidase [Clostridia bacterium]